MDYRDNCINIFLEYVSGGTISSILSKVGKFESVLVQSMTAQILYGLEYLHSRRVIHRDIKGANSTLSPFSICGELTTYLSVVVLVDEHGIAKISDFGISKRNEYNTAYKTNSRMSVQGSVFWMGKLNGAICLPQMKCLKSNV